MRADEIVHRAGVLGTRVNGHPEYCDEVLPELQTLLAETDDPVALTAVLYATQLAWHRDAVAAILRYADHPDGRVRLAVARGLPNGLDEGDELTLEVVRELLALMSDEVDEVRDWSTFALGTQLRVVDTPQVREALRVRLSDPDVDTRFEALAGLAYRHDPR